MTIPVEQGIPGKLLSSIACFRLPVGCKITCSIDIYKIFMEALREDLLGLCSPGLRGADGGCNPASTLQFFHGLL